MNQQDERRERLDSLTADIESEFDAVEEAFLDDATRHVDSAVIAVVLRAEETTYHPDPLLRPTTGYVITTNLNSFAPRLYNYVREYDGIARLQHVDIKPERVTEIDDVYDTNTYLMDVVLL